MEEQAMLEITADQQAIINERLRCTPSLSSVRHSLPVLFFGDLFTARIATVALNPSWQEYLSSVKQGKQEFGWFRAPL